MKRVNILLSLCFLAVMASCSMEDDILDNNSSTFVPEESSAFVSATINLGNAQTRSASEDTNTTGGSNQGETIDADYISNYALFLLDGTGHVVGVHTDSFTRQEVEDMLNQGGDPSKVKVQFMTKYNVATKAVAVVNYNPDNSENVLACSDKQALLAYKEHNAAYRLKFGEGNINWEGAGSSSSTTEELKPAEVSIRVESCTAIVELVEFAVKYKTDRKPDVKLVGVNISNLKANGGWKESLGIEAEQQFVFDRTKFPQAPSYYGDKGLFRADVYPNTDGGKTRNSFVTLNLRFSVTEGEVTKTYDRHYIINRPSDSSFTNNSGHTYVKAGNWYQLTATVKVASDNIDCDVVCYTQDWISNDITGSLTR